jgi:hypothetical protein
MPEPEILEKLHEAGCALAMIIADRWVGIRRTELGSWCLVSGQISDISSFERHCYCPTYDAAVGVFRAWWDRGFAGRAPCPYLSLQG